MNSDSITVVRSDYASTHPFFPAPLTLTSTTETAFSFANTTGPVVISIPLQAGIVGSSTPSDPNMSAAQLVSNLGRPGGARGPAPFYNSGSFDGRPFQLRACVKTTVTTSGTAGGASFAPKLYLGNSATLGSDTLLFSPTVINVPVTTTTSISSIVELTLMWDSGTVKVFGEGWANQGVAIAQASVYTARGALAAANGAAAAAVSNLQFVVSGVWTVNAPTTSTSTLTEFGLHQI